MFGCIKKNTYFCTRNRELRKTKPSAKGHAEVAQLVEHNLAKRRDARMVESVDTKDLKSFGYCSCAGSSPASSTEFCVNLL